MTSGEALLAGLVVVWSLPLVVLVWLLIHYVLERRRAVRRRDAERAAVQERAAERSGWPVGSVTDVVPIRSRRRDGSS